MSKNIAIYWSSILFITFLLIFYNSFLYRPYWIYEFDAEHLYIANIYSKEVKDSYLSILHPGILISKLYTFVFYVTNNLENSIFYSKIILQVSILTIYILGILQLKKIETLDFNFKAFLLLLFICNPFFFNSIDYQNSDQIIYSLSLPFFLINYQILYENKNSLTNLIILSILINLLISLKFSSLPLVILSFLIISLKLIIKKNLKLIFIFYLSFIILFLLFFWGILSLVPFILAKTFVNPNATSFGLNFLNSFISIFIVIFFVFSILYSIFITLNKILVKKNYILNFESNLFYLFNFFALLFCLYFFLASDLYVKNNSSINLIADRLRNINQYYIVILFCITSVLSRYRIVFSILMILIILLLLKFSYDRYNFIQKNNNNYNLIENTKKFCNDCDIFLDDYIRLKPSYFFHANTFVNNMYLKELNKTYHPYKFLNLREFFYDVNFLKLFEKFKKTPFFLNSLLEKDLKILSEETSYYENFIRNKSQLREKFCNYFSCIEFNYKDQQKTLFLKDEYLLLISKHHVNSLLNINPDNKDFFQTFKKYLFDKYQYNLERVYTKETTNNFEKIYIFKLIKG